MKILLYSFLFLLFFVPVVVLAHPGNTASDGAHYCRTNCDSWGVPWNQRHYHGGGSSSSSYSNFDYDFYSTPYSSPYSTPYYTPYSTPYSTPYTAPTTSCPLNAYSIGSSCYCNSGYEATSYGTCRYKSNYTNYSSYGSSSSCDVGYTFDKKNNKCKKISKSVNNKICQKAFGTKSEWGGKYDSYSDPTCSCKKNFEWNKAETFCVKEKL